MHTTKPLRLPGGVSTELDCFRESISGQFPLVGEDHVRTTQLLTAIADSLNLRNGTVKFGLEVVSLKREHSTTNELPFPNRQSKPPRSRLSGTPFGIYLRNQNQRPQSVLLKVMPEWEDEVMAALDSTFKHYGAENRSDLLWRAQLSVLTIITAASLVDPNPAVFSLLRNLPYTIPLCTHGNDRYCWSVLCA